MKNKTTYFQIILDQSGSMQSCIKETLSGFNEQIQMIKNLQRKNPEQTFITSLTVFSNEVKTVFLDKFAAELPELNETTYEPNGMTALYDAIGQNIMYAKSTYLTEMNRDEASVVMVILTDGHENASHVFSGKNIANLIKEMDQNKNWTVSYLGATLDAVEIATNLNIRKENALSFDTDDMQVVMKGVAMEMDAYVISKSENCVNKSFSISLEKDEE